MFGLVSLANKTSLAIGTWAFALMLEAIGFVANVDQSADTLAGMRRIMALAPVVGFIASAVVIWFFPFTTSEHRQMVREIRARRRNQPH